MGYKLHYFDIRYYAEPARMMFNAAGVEFEDVTFTKDEWADIKPKSPTGTAPWLEIDGHIIPESWALNRFLANRFGFNGKDEFEEATIDSTVHYFRTHFPKILNYLFTKAGFIQGDVDKLYENDVVPSLKLIFDFIKKQLSESNSGYICPSGITWIDLVLAENVLVFRCAIPGFEENYPDTIEYQERVHNHPKFKKYADSRKDYRICYLNDETLNSLEEKRRK